MALGAPREAMLADWNDDTFTTAPPEELEVATEGDIRALLDARPEVLVETSDFGGEGEFVEQSQVSKFGYVDESHKLYVGKEFTPEQFADWWGVQSFGSMPYNGVGVHHTAIPDRFTFQGLGHLHNVFNYYRTQLGWPAGKGPHIWPRSARPGKYVTGPKIYVGTHPAHDGIGISYRNHRYVHVEFIDRFDYYAPNSQDYWLYRFVLNIICGERGIPLKHTAAAGWDGPANPMDGYLFHRRSKTNPKTCPGSKTLEAAFEAAMNEGADVPAPKPPGDPEKDDAPLWINWAYLTEWGKKQAEACVAALHKNGYAKTLPTQKVVKAANDALDGVKGNHPCIVLGRNAWKVLPAGQRNKVESAMKSKNPYRYDLWYADSDNEVRWRLAKAARLAGLNVGEVLADYKAELDGATPEPPAEPPADAFTPGPDTGKPHMRGVYDLVGAERYSFTKLKAWAKTHDAHERVYEFIDAVKRVWKEAWPVVGAPLYAADMAIVQFCHETGFGHYPGDSRAWNPAGVKKAGRQGDTPADFEVPATAYEGARMLLNHMSIYVGGKPFGQVHGRYAEVKPIRWNVASTVDDLTGTWATDPKYATILRKFLNELEGDGGNEGGDVSKYDKAHDYLMACLGGPYVPWYSGPFTAGPPAWVRAAAPPAAEVARRGAFCAAAITLSLLKLGLSLPDPLDPEWEGGLLDYGRDYVDAQKLAVVYRSGMQVRPMDLFIVKYTGPALVNQGHTWIVGKNGKMIQWDGQYGGNNHRTLQDTINISSHGKTVYLIRREKWLG